MARVETVSLVDDMDGSAADEKMTFSIDGKSYEIDLSKVNATKLREILAPMVKAARNLGGRNRQEQKRQRNTDTEQNREIREWARQQGITVGGKGRIPEAVIERHKAETAGGIRLVREPENVQQEATERPRKGKPAAAIPSPFAVADEDQKIMTWWGEKGKKMPASGRVTESMRTQYWKANREVAV